MRLSATKTNSINQYRGLGNQLWDLAGERPSLDLPFSDTKSLVDATTGAQLVTFTRASSATFVGSDGLIKTATTNLLLQSEDFSTSWTTATATVTTNVATAPDGTTTADLYSGTSVSAVNQSISLTSGVTYTISFYVKSAGLGNDSFRLRIDTTQSSSNFTATPEWQRFSFTATSANTGARTCGILRNLANNNVDILIWGAQLEQSTTLGEYIPTTSTINSAPRFDHNPTTGESLGLLVEEARTNLSLYSEDFSNAYWAKQDCTITSNESTAPDGTLTADLWSNTGTPGVINSSITKDATARTYTSSLWVKGTLTQLTVSLDDGTTANRGRVQFNLSTNTVSSIFNEGLFTNTSGTLTRFLNGWVRVTVTTTTSIGTTIRFRPFFSGVNSILRIWGAQVEEGAFATSYIPTTTATVTRSADVASITGTAFSSWYREDEGTLFGDVLPYTTVGRIFSLNVGSNSERIALTRGPASGGNIAAIVTDNGVSQVSSLLLGTSILSFTNNRVAFGYKASDFAGSVNGLTPVTQGTGSLPTCTQATLGNGDSVGANQLNGTIRRLVYWGQRLPNNVLQAITQ